MYTMNGERTTLAGAKLFGTAAVISSFSSLSWSQIGDADGAWYQLLMYRDTNLMNSFISTAVAAGCAGIVLTVDAPLGCSMCKRDSTAAPVIFPHLAQLPLLPQHRSRQFGTFDEYYQYYMPGEIDWDAVASVISRTKVPVIIKGVLTNEDVELAIVCGAAGVIVSNHGGRQNDASPGTLRALAMLDPKLLKKTRVFLDGGIRRGTDVFKALCLGAKAVFIGRPAIYGLAVGGAEGLCRVLEILATELQDTMRATGCESLADLTRDKLVSRKLVD
jgi:isopentenyl diphosphate isomerase/L-lactate dehydrogenase-like FMN-dependent dehydrogenase